MISAENNVVPAKQHIKVMLLATLALLSGCCSLAYEILYMRALTPILGDMFYVHAALLSTFLVGIGLGAKIAHRWLRWLWAFQIMTGLYALGLPYILKWFSQQVVLSTVTSSPSLTILVTISLLSIPSLLIGFSIPLFSAYVKACYAERLAFQGIYKIYNLGAFVSILGVELAIVRQLGITSSLTLVGVINIFNGIVLVLMRVAPSYQPAEKPRSFPRRVVIALALGSLASAVFQMFFLKLSYLVFHPHRENFAIAISISLLGLSIGTWLVSKVGIRFETLLIFVPILIGLIYASYLPLLQIYNGTVSSARSSEFLIFVHKFAFGCIFALGPMILFGGLIPALMRTEKEVAGESGHLLWVSSLANATGYLLYVLVAHRLFPSHVLLAVISGFVLLASLLTTKFQLSRLQRIVAVCGVTLVVLMVFSWKERNFYLAHWVNDRLKPDDEVTVYKSGAESATLVNSKDTVWVSYNGQPSIYVRIKGVVNYSEIISGVIPALSAPHLDRALVLGLGTGITGGAAACLFKTTDVVEINNAFYKMLPTLSYANFDIDNNPSAILHLTDGRAFLVGKDGTYDAIINSIPAPTYFSASKIYTLQFYKRVAKALKPDGVFCTWLSVDTLSEEGLLTVLSALQQNFRYCDLRIMRGDYYMATCSNEPINPRRFSELPRHKNLVKHLKVGLVGFDLDEYFDDIRVSNNLFEHFVPKVAKENTDDHPVLEFMVVRAYQLKKMGGNPFLKQQDMLNIDPVRQHELEDTNRLARRAAVFYLHNRYFFTQNFLPILKKDTNQMATLMLWTADFWSERGKYDEAIKFLTEALRIKPDFAAARNKLNDILKSQKKTN